MQNSKETKNVIKPQEKSVAKGRLGRVIAAIVMLVVFAAFISPMMLNSKGIKSEIESKISEAYGASFVINGNVSFAFFPSPTVVVKDAYLLNYQPKVENNFDSGKVYNFYAGLIKIKMSFFGRKITSLVFSNALLESYNFNRQPVATSDRFSTFIPHEPLNSAASSGFFSFSNLKQSDIDIKNVPLIVVKSSTLALYDAWANKKQFEKINLEMSFTSDKTKVSGDFVSDGNVNKVNLKFYFNDNSKDNKSLLSVDSASGKINLKGNFSSPNGDLFLSSFSGEILADIADLKSFYNGFLDNEGLIAKKLKQNNKAIKVAAKINSSAGQINVTDLEISSDVAKGKGSMVLDIANKIPVIEIILNLEKLNIDDFWSGEFVSLAMPKYKDNNKEDEKDANVIQITSEESGALSVRNIDLTADIKIANARFLDGDIKNVDLYLSVANHGQVLILPMMFTTPDGGSVWLSGVFDNDSNPPRFVGKFSLLGKNLADILKWSKLELQNLRTDTLKDFKVHSDLTLWPNGVAFDNIYLSLSGNKNEFLGSVKIDGEQKPTKITANFNIDDFIVENYFLISSQSTYFSPGLLIKKLFWLNSLSFDSSTSLHFNRLVYKDEEFFDQKINFDIGVGKFSINKLNLKSNKTEAQIDLNIDIANQDPRFDLIAVAKDFHYENLDDVKEDDSLLDKVSKAVSDNKTRNFVDQFYSLPSLEGFRGKVEMDFVNLNLDGFKVKNAKIFGKLKDGGLNVEEASGEIFNGNFIYRGLLGLKGNKIFNGNLTLQNIGVKPLLNTLFDLENIDGLANVSLSIASLADKKEDFFQSFSSEVKFSVSRPVIIGYGLNDLVTKMFAQSSNMAALQNPEGILFDKNSTTILESAEGIMQVKNNGSGIFKINTTAVAANGIFSGDINIKNKRINGLYNVVFLSGTREKQVPLSIASNIKGDIADVVQTSNLNQVRQYLGLPLLQESAVIKIEKKEEVNNEVNNIDVKKDETQNIAK
jgi:hypothetical protein